MAATANNRGPGDIELETMENASYEFPQPDEGLLARTDTDSSKPLSEQDITPGMPDDLSSGAAPAHPAPLSHPSIRTKILSNLGLLSIAWWIPEIAASILALICLESVIIVSTINDGRPITTLKLPTSLSLNATLSVLSTLNRSLLLVPVSSAIMQDLWIWYTACQEGKTCNSRFRHLDAANAASRGPWGSSTLLVHYRGRRYVFENRDPQWILSYLIHRPWAYLGAIITMASIFFGPSVQQLINYDHKVPDPSIRVPNIAWSRHAPLELDPSSCKLNSVPHYMVT